MRLISPGKTAIAWLKLALAACLALTAAGCVTGPIIIPPSEQPLSKESMMLLGKKGMETHTPIFIRIFKEESELEIWKARYDGRYYHFKTYPICNWSGQLGPKQKEGDKQAPEGFYSVTQQQLNPNSSYYLAFNLGFPNAYDKAKNRTGKFLMIHGKCKSAGCYAMTDALVEEIYALGRDALRGGQQAIPVHAFPFRMTDEKLARHKKSEWYKFWRVLKKGYDVFEEYRIPPTVAVCERRYVVNVLMPPYANVDPVGRCPRFAKPVMTPFIAGGDEQQIASERITVNGFKKRNAPEGAQAPSGNAPLSLPPADLSGGVAVPAPQLAQPSSLGYR